MSDCVIQYPKGRCVLKDCKMGDPRVSKELERIVEGARQGLWRSHPVTVDFVDDADERWNAPSGSGEPNNGD